MTREGEMFCLTRPKQAQAISYFDFKVFEDEETRRAISTDRIGLAHYRDDIKAMQPAELSEIKTF